MANRRSDVRKKAATKIDATITYADALTHAKSCIVKDMSKNGIFLKTDRSMNKDAYIGMKLDTEDLIGRKLWAQGVVVRTEEDGVGIKFTYVEQDLAKILK
ncbi:PilZ domain-containing protein [archaeon]|nr:PilZ domain-containing protein [archaeon]